MSYKLQSAMPCSCITQYNAIQSAMPCSCIAPYNAIQITKCNALHSRSCIAHTCALSLGRTRRRVQSLCFMHTRHKKYIVSWFFKTLLPSWLNSLDINHNHHNILTFMMIVIISTYSWWWVHANGHHRGMAGLPKGNSPGFLMTTTTHHHHHREHHHRHNHNYLHRQHPCLFE